MQDLIELYRGLDRKDECILNAIFDNMWDFEYVPVHAIARECGISEEKIELALKKLGGMRITENKYTEYLGASFTFKGLSVFSLKRLVNKNAVSMLGNIMGEGKESVVYNAMSERYGEVVVKFHRVGYPSFKKVKEKRDYGSLHYTVLTVRSAKREYNALKKLYGYASVPQPVAWEGNAVVTRLIDAKELFRVKISNPGDVLDMILEEIKKMYARGIIHGDLSQFNILVNSDGVWIIDFPQSVDTKDPMAQEYLERDVKNVLDYFERTYRLKKDLKEVMKYIKDET
ncbi:RIO1 family regulatory kinase/ATPase [Geoglobus acetivorans]|uniref:RIO1 family regulatory kinase/ATPase domain-containing protein n=1 Tax=Geoglobus acetivorans TaxID=565033 RepID=UPI00187F6FB5|nr:phosphotransferase [Geoglobus acetivorans]